MFYLSAKTLPFYDHSMIPDIAKLDINPNSDDLRGSVYSLDPGSDGKA